MRRPLLAASFLSLLLACACGGGSSGGSSPSPAPAPSPSPTPPPSAPSPLTIRDAVTISVDSSGNWPEDGISVAASYGIEADWGSYSSAQPLTGATSALAAKVAEVHGRGQLYLQYLVAGILWTGNGALGDVRPDLLDYVAIDIDGRRIAAPFGSMVMNRSDVNEEGWREFLRSEMAAAIDSGVDGFVIDDIQAQTLHIGFDSAGVFNEPDMRGFREFLTTIYTSEELASRYGIEDIGAFNYRDYIVSRGLAQLWRTAPWNVPLFNQFRTFEYRSTLAAYAELFAWARSYSQSRNDKPLVFLGNTSTGGDMNLPFEQSLDLAWLEFPYLHWGYPPRSKTIPASKLTIDGRWKKGTYLTQVPTNEDLDRRGSPPNLAKVLFAEAHAARSEYQVPFKVVGGPVERYAPNLRELAPYYQFLAKNRWYFGGDWRWRPRVAILYPLAAYLGSADSYYGAAMALLDAGIQFDALVSGDDRILPNTITLDRLRQYPVLVLASPGAMSAAQVRLVLDYLEAGGLVVAWGSLGDADELVRYDVARPSDWRTVQSVGERRVGAGTVANLSSDDLGSQYFTGRAASMRARIVDAVARAAPPEVTVAASNVVAVAYCHATDPVLLVHLVNYNYNIDNDSVAAVHNLTVALAPPAGYSMDGKRARLLSPDFSQAEDVAYEISGGTVYLQVPRIEFYGILVVEPIPASASDTLP